MDDVCFDNMVVGECMFVEKMKYIFKEVELLRVYINYLIRVILIIVLEMCGCEVCYIIVDYDSGYKI